MKFGPVPLAQAEGAVLAHSLRAGDARLKKGRLLTAADIVALAAAGVTEITVARLADGDIDENTAARMLAEALVPDPDAAGLRLSAPFTGRVNIHADAAGLLQVDLEAVLRINLTEPSITLATLPELARVSAGALVATVKIIPYGVARRHVAAACEDAAGALRVAPFTMRRASLILTRTPGMKDGLLSKGRDVVVQRLQGLGCDLAETTIVAHETTALAAALADAGGELLLVLSGSATSDIGDVGPAALVAAGGELARFGMPVDPGNLLFIGSLNGRPVVGLPGCARSPALNGADWVLERLACGLAVGTDDIAAMGVGGLLKEIPIRPQPRGHPVSTPVRPLVEVVLLAAGASRRMRGRDKLLELVDGEPLLRRTARAVAQAKVAKVQVVVPPGHEARRAALDGLGVAVVISPEWQEGMAASLRAGLAEVSDGCDAVIVALADMPEVTAKHLDALIAAYDPGENQEICRALDAEGTPGHPVLFGRRFFESLSDLKGDRGGREVLAAAPEFLVDVPTEGRGASVDLDTPQAWADWHSSRQARQT